MGIGVIVASMALTHEAGEHNPHPQLLKTKGDQISVDRQALKVTKTIGVRTVEHRGETPQELGT